MILSKDDSKLIFNQDTNKNLTQASDIIDISVQDVDSNQIPVKGMQSLVAFTNLSVQDYTNLVCGYYDTINKQWLLDTDGGLSTKLTTVDSKRRIECTTSHLSTFSVFKIQDPYSPTTIITIVDDDRRIAVNVIQAILIALSLVLFILQVKTEKKKRDLDIQTYNFAKLESRMKVTRVLGEYSKLFALFMGVKLSLFSRFLIFINYLLWVSLYVLSNFAISRNSPRLIGDMVYLIISLIVVFLFSAPFFKHYFIVVFYKFKQI